MRTEFDIDSLDELYEDIIKMESQGENVDSLKITYAKLFLHFLQKHIQNEVAQ